MKIIMLLVTLYTEIKIIYVYSYFDIINSSIRNQIEIIKKQGNSIRKLLFYKINLAFIYLE